MNIKFSLVLLLVAYLSLHQPYFMASLIPLSFLVARKQRYTTLNYVPKFGAVKRKLVGYR